MEIDEFASKVIAEKNKCITDEIFLMIQNDPVLMREYLRLIEEHKLNPVNMKIGKEIKKAYNLTNEQSRNEKPRSTLIKSYQEFE
ncbi:MAG: hypothetical protein FWD28_02980 [Treponema sp.]|nr:hypothetical protein [Treponema sp.]